MNKSARKQGTNVIKKKRKEKKLNLDTITFAYNTNQDI